MLAVGSAQPARADIIFYPDKPGKVQPDENLLFNDPSLTLAGTTVNGITNTTATLFDITGQETLVADGGQAKVSGSDGTFTEMLIEPDAVDTFFTEFEANLAVFHDRGPTPTGTVTVTTTDKLGSTLSFPYDVGAGENFFSFLATDPDLLRSISISSTVPLAEIRQIRVGGLTGPEVSVPEPATLVVFGLGLVAAGRRLRRRRA
jgi:hypothetical protein